MASNEIEALSCQYDFGKPSGHALVGSTIYGCLMILFVAPWIHGKSGINLIAYEDISVEVLDTHHNEIETKPVAQGEQTESHTVAEPARIAAVSVAWICFICFNFVIGLSRVYLGVHSYSQVILGWLIGINLCLIVFTYVDRKYQHFLHSLAQKEPGTIPCFTLEITLVFLAIMMVPAIFYGTQDTHDTNNVEWLINLHSKCHVSPTKPILLTRDFIGCTSIATAFGFLYGILLCKGSYNDKLDEHFNIGVCKLLGRALIYAMCAAGPYVGIDQMPVGDNAYLHFFVIQCLQYFLPAFFIIVLPPWLFYKLKWDKEDDFMKYPMPKALDTQ
jgi:hypothetical protein